MKSLSHTLLSLSAALCVSVFPISTHAATSDPVGAMTVTVPAGFSIVAHPFVNADEVVGVLQGREGNVLSFSGLSAGAYDSNYYLELTNDTNGTDSIDTEGLVIDIISNTTDSFTLSGDLSGVNGDEAFVVRKHVTLESLFSGATGLTPYSDSFTFYLDGTTSAYTTDGNGNWFDLSTFQEVSNIVVYPGMGFVAGTQNNITITFFGSVKLTKTQIPVYGGGAPNIVGFLNPAESQDLSLVDLSLLQEYTDSFTKYSSDGSLSASGSYTYGNGAVYDLSTFGTTSVSSDSSSALVFIAPNSDTYIKTPGISITQ